MPSRSVGPPADRRHATFSDDLADRAQQPQRVAGPEAGRIGGAPRIDDLPARRAGSDGSFGHARAEQLVAHQRAVRATCKAIGERAADVDPEFPRAL